MRTFFLLLNYELKINWENIIFSIFIIFSVTSSTLSANETTGGRDFTQRVKHNLFGDIEVIGNTVLCILNNGTCVEPSNSNSNADTNLLKAPQSYSTLTLPTNAVVEYARIYWQGRRAATTSDETWDESSKTAAGKIQIRKGSSGVFTELSADIKDFDSISSNHYVRTYSAGADASSIVDSSGVYYIDTNSFYTNTGETNQLSPDDGLGNYGAWVLVVIYSDPNETEAKNITIFDGYKIVKSGDDVDVSLSGFLTPKTGDVDSKTYVFAAEGDKYLTKTGDVIKMAGATYNTTLQELGTFDSRVDVPAIRNPDLDNNNGIDIHVYDTGTTAGAKNIITNYETGAKFQFTSDQDTYFPSLIVFSTELYSPKFCYDYSYKQQDVYFTEDNDGSLNPKISGKVELGEDIEVTVFIRNLVDSDISVTDMFIDVFDINTSQASYITDSIKLTEIGDVIPVDIPDSLLDVGSTSNGDYVNNIEIGTIDTDAYFYLYYSVDPHVEDLNMSINVQARYNILVEGKYIPYTLQLGPQMPMCSSTNFTYLPTPGIFNVVHNDYYNFDLAGTNRFYNLPTQVTSRVGNFKVLALNPSDNDALLEDHNVIFAEVEMIDAGVFHDTDASCYQQGNSISDSIPIMFDSNVTSVLFNNTIVNSNFYTNARENTAFRISYYVRDSNDSTLPDYTKDGNSGNSSDSYTANWSMNWTGETCVVDMDSALDSNGNMSPMTTDDKVANWCQTGGSGMSEEQALACLKCVYGDQKNFVCSRDNFAIRPEAFLMNLGDQDQNDATQELPLTTGFSGTVGATASVLDLAAGYNYSLKVDATNYVDNSPSSGYTRTFSNTLLIPTDYAQYIWDPTTATTGCNDNANMTTTIKFVNGKVDTNSSTSQVGEYRLSIQDTLWTTVDSNPLFMTHHTGDYFLDATIPDCALGSSNVFAINTPINFSNETTRTDSLTGCIISSNHRTPITNIQYNDIDIVSHPYQFNMAGITPSVGLTNTPINPNSFVYMSDMNAAQDSNMSFHLNGTISAVGFDNSALSNFVDNCYAEPVSLTLTKTAAADNTLDYRYRFYNTDIAANDQNGSLNLATDMITLNTSDFNGSNNGSVNIRVNLNFNRNMTVRNPESITYTAFDSNATSTFNANLITETLRGTRDLNNSAIAHYYGRTHAGRQRFVGNQGVANIYYEVYCFDTIAGNTCDKTLLQDGLDSNRTNDLRWYINTQHNVADDGNVSDTLLIERDGGNFVTENFPARVVNNRTEVTLNYNGNQGYPYKTTMENNASSWLIYNENNPGAMRNFFSVEFDQAGSNWSGAHETDATTNDSGVTTTNRRSMW